MVRMIIEMVIKFPYYLEFVKVWFSPFIDITDEFWVLSSCFYVIKFIGRIWSIIRPIPLVSHGKFRGFLDCSEQSCRLHKQNSLPFHEFFEKKQSQTGKPGRTKPRGQQRSTGALRSLASFGRVALQQSPTILEIRPYDVGVNSKNKKKLPDIVPVGERFYSQCPAKCVELDVRDRLIDYKPNRDCQKDLPDWSNHCVERLIESIFRRKFRSRFIFSGSPVVKVKPKHEFFRSGLKPWP